MKIEWVVGLVSTYMASSCHWLRPPELNRAGLAYEAELASPPAPHIQLVGQEGVEPPTGRLSSGCSSAELLAIGVSEGS